MSRQIFFGECWEWIGYRDPNGYGRATVSGKQVLVHRYVYSQLIGAIPAGLTLDHLCRNRACCNPAHLEPVTIQENINRGTQGAYQRNKTHCKSGHSFAQYGGKGNRGRRLCMECRRIWCRQQRARKANK